MKRQRRAARTGTGSASSITGLLKQWRDGDREAAERLFELLYQELHRLAEGYFRRENPGHTLQATALVHEAYVRMERFPPEHWKSRAHFLGIAARAMRQVLVDHARARTSARRGGGAMGVSLESAESVSTETPEGLLRLHEALRRLREKDPRQETIVVLRFFGGLTQDEIAESMAISKATVTRLWRRARAWLHAELADPE